MASKLVSERRIRRLNDLDVKDGQYTLYWMQQSQRAEFNPALEYSVQMANERQEPLVVGLILDAASPGMNARRARFILQGLEDIQSRLARRHIALLVRMGDGRKTIQNLAENSSQVVCDRGYLRHQVEMRSELARSAQRRVIEVEGDVIVPVESASEKREYAARTIRKKLQQAAPDFAVELTTTAVDRPAEDLSFDTTDLDALADDFLQHDFSDHVEPVDWIEGGTRAAKAALDAFLSDRLNHYRDGIDVNDSNASRLSPYLHFGQISPLQIYLSVNEQDCETPAKEAFLEELLVRRELAINFVHYASDYDSLASLPDWASETLSEHESDERPHHYTASQLEQGDTHDRTWNAMMKEMRERGYLHNHLRMYWGKKIIEWTNTVDHAYRVALDLNNRYFLDGWDANSFANVLWLFGLHDRAHAERDVFGKVRFMSNDGLHRKIDADAYANRILTGEA